MIRVYEPKDSPQVTALLSRAYGRPNEASLVQDLRARGDLQAELVWTENGQILGHAAMARHLHPKGWHTISTVAVDAPARGRGIGSDLVRACLEDARQADAGAVTVLGNARYYQRFGFTRTAAEALETPFAKDETLMYPIRIENAGIMAELVFAPAYECL
jgi:putative acetyltransferase